jgi:hypothetical protein
VAGSIRLKDHRLNVWELRIYVGRDSTGRVRHRQATFHGRGPTELTRACRRTGYLTTPVAAANTAGSNKHGIEGNRSAAAWRLGRRADHPTRAVNP